MQATASRKRGTQKGWDESFVFPNGMVTDRVARQARQKYRGLRRRDLECVSPWRRREGTLEGHHDDFVGYCFRRRRLLPRSWRECNQPGKWRSVLEIVSTNFNHSDVVESPSCMKWKRTKRWWLRRMCHRQEKRDWGIMISTIGPNRVIKLRSISRFVIWSPRSLRNSDLTNKTCRFLFGTKSATHRACFPKWRFPSFHSLEARV